MLGAFNSAHEHLQCFRTLPQQKVYAILLAIDLFDKQYIKFNQNLF